MKTVVEVLQEQLEGHRGQLRLVHSRLEVTLLSAEDDRVRIREWEAYIAELEEVIQGLKAKPLPKG